MVWITVDHETIPETRGDSNDTDTGTDMMMGNSSDKNDRYKLYGGTGRGTRMGYYGGYGRMEGRGGYGGRYERNFRHASRGQGRGIRLMTVN